MYLSFCTLQRTPFLFPNFIIPYPSLVHYHRKYELISFKIRIQLKTRTTFVCAYVCIGMYIYVHVHIHV